MILRTSNVAVAVTQRDQAESKYSGFYRSSLDRFMAESDETKNDSLALAWVLAEALRRHWRSPAAPRKPFRWIDLGTGDGIKLCAALQIVLIERDHKLYTGNLVGENLHIEVEIFEKEEPVRLKAFQRIQALGQRIVLSKIHIAVKCGGYFTNFHEKGGNKDYALITCIHSLYQFPIRSLRTFEGSTFMARLARKPLRRFLNSLNRLLAFEGIDQHVHGGTLLLVITESTTSAFYQAKRAAYYNRMAPPLSWRTIRRSLPYMEYCLSRMTVKGWWLTEPQALEDLDDPDFPSFLACTSDSDRLSQDEFLMVLRDLGKFLKGCLVLVDPNQGRLRVDSDCMVFDFYRGVDAVL